MNQLLTAQAEAKQQNKVPPTKIVIGEVVESQVDPEAETRVMDAADTDSQGDSWWSQF